MGKFITVFENRCDEPFREFKDGCCGSLRTNDSCGDKYILEIADCKNISDLSDGGCLVIGDLFQDNGYGSAGGRVYDINGICPCIGDAHFSQVKYILVAR